MSDRTTAVDRLIAQAKELDQAVEAYTDRWPSARVSHHRFALLGALQREYEAVVTLEAKPVKTAAAKRYDQFDIDMAAKIGIPVEELEGWRERRRQESLGLGSLEEQLAAQGAKP